MSRLISRFIVYAPLVFLFFYSYTTRYLASSFSSVFSEREIVTVCVCFLSSHTFVRLFVWLTSDREVSK